MWGDVARRIELIVVWDDGADARVFVAHECPMMIDCSIVADGADVEGVLVQAPCCVSNARGQGSPKDPKMAEEDVE
eukprot:11615340-Alexandrium_andersonii.AAC.1